MTTRIPPLELRAVDDAAPSPTSDASRCRAIVNGDGGDWYLCGHNRPCVWHGASGTQED